EQVVRQHLRGQWTVIAGPAQIAMDALPMRFLADADLQRVKASLTANLRGDDLIDRRSGAASPRIGGARAQPAHRFVMTIAGTRKARSGIVQAPDDVNVLLKRSKRRQAGRERVIGAGILRNPVP